MNPVGSNSVNTYAAQQNKVDQAKTADNVADAAPLKVEQNKVTLSSEGKALLAALKQIDHESKKSKRKIKPSVTK